MTKEKLVSVARFYREWIGETIDGLQGMETPEFPTSYMHLMWMCGKIEGEFAVSAEQKDVEKGMRWLGFVQGVLAARGDFTLAELRAHSRS